MLRCSDANPPIRTLFLRHWWIFCHHIQTLRPLPAEQHTDYSLSFYNPPILFFQDETKKSALSTRCHYFLLLFLLLSFDAQSIITPLHTQHVCIFSTHLPPALHFSPLCPALLLLITSRSWLAHMRFAHREMLTHRPREAVMKPVKCFQPSSPSCRQGDLGWGSACRRPTLNEGVGWGDGGAGRWA